MSAIVFIIFLVCLLVVSVTGYELGHRDGIECNCAPNQPFWRKWINKQETITK